MGNMRKYDIHLTAHKATAPNRFQKKELDLVQFGFEAMLPCPICGYQGFKYYPDGCNGYTVVQECRQCGSEIIATSKLTAESLADAMANSLVANK